MDVVAASSCEIRVGSLYWQPREGSHVLTVVAKATYLLQPGRSPLGDQETLNEEDNHWDDDPSA